MVQYDPFRDEFQGDVYYYGVDAFYLPFSGLDSVERGGPRIQIWELAEVGS